MVNIDAESVYVVQEQPNPSTDFFVLPALTSAGFDTVNKIKLCNFNQLPTLQQLQGAVVVFVRYIPRNWQRLVTQARSEIKQVILFIDDDLLVFSASQGMPWRYRIKLARLITTKQSWLKHIGAKLWVSTPFLHNKYNDWSPQLVTPKPPAGQAEYIRIFYHGSASHSEEIRWLYPVIKTTLENHPNVSFEIIGGADVNRLFRSLPRVNIIHPMKWPSYSAFLSQPGRDIGLAPLLNLPFNQARSYTKFFDITSAGAIGIYAHHPVFTPVIEHGINGLLVEMDPQLWIDAIKALAMDQSRRQAMQADALQSMMALKNGAKD